jgi:hypothetical protein
MTETEKNKAKKFRQDKDDFALHILLVQRAENCTTAKARIIAWGEGRNGLNKRLGQTEMKV